MRGCLMTWSVWAKAVSKCFYPAWSASLNFLLANGIEEMTEDLNSGQVMYAFLQVTDPKTSLPKNVLVIWQGEGAPNVRKGDLALHPTARWQFSFLLGTCANHVRDVSNFFKGAHVTINARTEDEIDSSIIIDKVSKSTGSVYKFNERADSNNDAEPVPVVSKNILQF